MRLKSVIKGVVICSAIGTAYYMMSETTPKQRKHMKKTLSKGIRNFGSICNGVSYIL